MYIKTKRLVLKPISDKDRDNVIELLTDAEVKKTYMVPDFETMEQVEKLFLRLRDLSLSNDFYEVGIFLDDELIGFANEVERENDKIELGYAISPKHHNKGYATEMLKALTEALFEDGFSEVVTGAFEENAASIRVMEKCGMEKLDKVEKIEYRGVMYTCVYYSKKKLK